jgi:ubiquinone/menaquinone biosynthesis C-methylase UbiE
VSSYVIRGGAEGKARLSVLSAALGPSTGALLEAAGVREGMHCLDLGCGGGDVALAIARMVTASGSVVGIDVDAVKIDLARADAVDAGIGHIDYQVGDALGFDAQDAYDVVYARLLLTHLADPETMLARMVGATKPGGVVVVEDLDHSAVFVHPGLPALDRYVSLYNEVARRRGGNPEIGPELPGMFRRAGLGDVVLTVAQPVLTDGPAKRIHQLTLENVRDTMVLEGVATADELDHLAAELEAHCTDAETIVSFPRIFQVFGRRPA